MACILWRLNMQNEEPIRAMLEEQKRVRAEQAKVICRLLEKCIDFDIYPDVIAKVDGHPDRVTRTSICQNIGREKYCQSPTTSI